AGREHLQGAAPKGLLLLAHRQHTPRPVEQRMGVDFLALYIDSLVTVERVHDRRRHETRRVSAGEATVAVQRPLHGCANTVAVPEEEVVAHADFIAVVEGRRTGHG